MLTKSKMEKKNTPNSKITLSSTSLDSPWGILEIKYSDRGIYSLDIVDKKTRPTENPSALAKDCVRQLNRYFECAEKKIFAKICLDYSDYTPFQRKVLQALSKVEVGKVTNYEELAKKIENPRGARAIGHVMSLNRTPIILPCHRVIRKDGSLGGFAYGLDWKKKLLRHEGISLNDGLIRGSSQKKHSML